MLTMYVGWNGGIDYLYAPRGPVFYTLVAHPRTMGFHDEFQGIYHSPRCWFPDCSVPDRVRNRLSPHQCLTEQNFLAPFVRGAGRCCYLVSISVVRLARPTFTAAEGSLIPRILDDKAMYND